MPYNPNERLEPETCHEFSCQHFVLQIRFKDLSKRRDCYLSNVACSNSLSDVFQATPDLFKQQVYQILGEAISTKKTDPDFAYLAATEKKAIRHILRETLSDLPDGW